MNTALLFALLAASPAESLVTELKPALTTLAGQKQMLLYTGSKDPVCNELPQQLLGIKGLKLVDEKSRTAAMSESGLNGVMDAASAREFAGAVGAGAVLTCGTEGAADMARVVVKLLDVVSGKVLGSASARAVEATVAEAPADSAGNGSLEVRVRQLGDGVAKALEELSGEARYQRFAVLPLEDVGDAVKEKQLGLVVASELTTVLTRDHRYFVVERSQIAKVLNELALGQTGVIDESKTAEVGKLLGADGLVIGTVADAGARYRVNARVVSTETGQVVAAASVDIPAADLVALSADAVVLRSASGATYRSILLPGWGQFYNRQPVKGGVFAATEVALAGLALGFHLRGNSAKNAYNDLGAGTTREEFAAQRDKAHDDYQWRNRAFFGVLAMHAIGILDAFLNSPSFDASPGGGG